MSKYVPVELRRSIRNSFFGCCAYCQTDETLTVAIFEIEHIVPQSSGGATEFGNLCLACPSCNRFKSNRTTGKADTGKADTGKADTGIELRLFHPQKDVWLDHFDWSINGTLIVGLTAVAHATINTLCMNRKQMVDVRALWVEVGRHPPR